MSLTLSGERARTRAIDTRVRGARGRPAWMATYRATLLISDAAAALLAGVVAQFLRMPSGLDEVEIAGLPLSYAVLSLGLVPIWLGALALGGGYDSREVGNGSEEYRRVLNSAVRVLALVAVISYAAQLALARGFVAIVLPLAMVLTVVFRHLLRKWLHRQRAAGRFTNQVVVVGSVERATELVRHFRRAPYAGFTVLGVCIPGSMDRLSVDGVELPVLGVPADAESTMQQTAADAVAISDDVSLAPGALRRLAWSLEGSGIDLIVVPALTDVAGPRIVTRPVAGLPLLHVEEPVLSGAARVFKEVFDRSLAALALLVVGPLLVGVAAAVRLTSAGPPLYRQTRVGKDGRHFTILKFRTMRNGAEQDRWELDHLNERDGPLFKVRDDPRKTGLGHWLRRFSIDEMPQIWHVLTGHMSLVGPRPPLPSEVEQYDEHTSRRLLVKPGLTGLWQVSGRSDLSWEESVRLDLYYVENWSPALDALILWKTVWAVLQGRGAY